MCDCHLSIQIPGRNTIYHPLAMLLQKFLPLFPIKRLFAPLSCDWLSNGNLIKPGANLRSPFYTHALFICSASSSGGYSFFDTRVVGGSTTRGINKLHIIRVRRMRGTKGELQTRRWSNTNSNEWVSLLAQNHLQLSQDHPHLLTWQYSLKFKYTHSMQHSKQTLVGCVFLFIIETQCKFVFWKCTIYPENFYSKKRIAHNNARVNNRRTAAWRPPPGVFIKRVAYWPISPPPITD